MSEKSFPVLKGETLFRKGELVFINKSNELQEYCNVIHKHDFIEISYVMSGRGIHKVGVHEYEISKGDLFIINYDVPHGFFPSIQSDNGPEVYNCIFMPQFLDASLFSSYNFLDITSSFLFNSLFPDERVPGADLRLKGAEFHEIGDLFSKMYSEYKLMKKGYCDIIRAYLIELIVKTFRYLEQDTQIALSVKNKELVDQAIAYLKSNYDTDIKLDDLAMRSFISKNYFSRLFKEVAGISFSDYVQKLRIDEACSLLKNTDMKVVDIASKVGFNDLKFFYSVFKKITGKTPGDFRKN